MRLLAEYGADPHIHLAPPGGDAGEPLVERGADVTAKTRLGQSTADMARGGRAGYDEDPPAARPGTPPPG